MSEKAQNDQEPTRLDPLSREIRLRFPIRPAEKLTDDQEAVTDTIRVYGRRFADLLVSELPNCRERSLALTKLEEAVFHAKTAVARRS